MTTPKDQHCQNTAPGPKSTIISGTIIAISMFLFTVTIVIIDAMRRRRRTGNRRRQYHKGSEASASTEVVIAQAFDSQKTVH